MPKKNLTKNLDALLPDSWGRLSSVLGLELVSSSKGKVTVRMPHQRAASQMAGLFHGGALTTLADTAAAIGTLSDLPAGWATVTSELKINFISNILRGNALAKALRLHKGRKTQVWEVKVYEEGTRHLLAVLIGTFFVIPPQKLQQDKAK